MGWVEGYVGSLGHGEAVSDAVIMDVYVNRQLYAVLYAEGFERNDMGIDEFGPYPCNHGLAFQGEIFSFQSQVVGWGRLRGISGPGSYGLALPKLMTVPSG